MDHNKLCKALKQMEIPDHLTYLLVKKQQLQPWMEQLIGSRLRKEYDRVVCCQPACLIYTLSKHIMRNAELEELHAGLKIGGRNNNIRCADDTTLMAESEEELKSL